MNRFVYKYIKYLLILFPILLILIRLEQKSKEQEQKIAIIDKDIYEEIFLNKPHDYLSNKSTAIKFNYFHPASNSTHTDRILRAVIVYFPIKKHKHFESEFRWLYRSWVEMTKYEPAQWRTDLIVFIENDNEFFKNLNFFLNQLKCSFKNKRTSRLEKPMCTLIDYIPLNKEIFKFEDGENKLLKYFYLLEKVDIYSNNESNLLPFYTLLQTKLSKYGYLDSILMAFDGYDYFKSADYDFLVRADMDVFLTPFFGLWIPKYCNDFIVGGGAYSENFNRKRLKKIAHTLNLGYIGADNLGSTWYSTVEQFRLVSYLTLNMMMYISSEEFTKAEKEGKISFWPYWSHGVVLLYGQVLLNIKKTIYSLFLIFFHKRM